MATRDGHGKWNGNLADGSGTVKTGSGLFEGPFSFKSRFEEGEGTNPEELLGAAHAGCFSMALSHALDEAGHTAESVETTAKVTLQVGDDGPVIPTIELVTTAVVPGIDEAKFQEIAEATKAGCPVSKALAGPEISLDATLAG